MIYAGYSGGFFMEKARCSLFIRIIFLVLLSIGSCKCSAGMFSTIAGHAVEGTKSLVRAVHALGASGVVGCATSAAAFYGSRALSQRYLHMSNFRAGMAGCAAAAATFYTLRVLFERYFTLADYRDALVPPAGEDLAGRRKHIYTWHPQGLDLSTMGNLHIAAIHDANNHPTENINDSRLIYVLRRDCIAFNVYRHADVDGVLNGAMAESDLHPIISGEIHWSDLIATLNYEIRKLTEIKEYLRKASRWRLFWGIDRYSIGAERDLVNALHAQGIMRKEDERQMTAAAENAVNHIMTQPVSQIAGILAAIFGEPNYDITHGLYWIAYRRLLWLETLSGIIERAAASQNCFDRIFAVVRDHAVYEIDPNGQAHIVAPTHAVRRPGAPAADGNAHNNAHHRNG